MANKKGTKQDEGRKTNKSRVERNPGNPNSKEAKERQEKTEGRGRESVVRQQPDTSFDERTRVQQPWRDEDGNQVTGEGQEGVDTTKQREPQIVTPEEKQ